MMNSPVPLTDIFSRSDLFAGLEAGQLTDMLRAGQRCVYDVGTALFREGDPAVKTYLVLKSSFKLSKLHEEGKEAIVRYIETPLDGIEGMMSRKKNRPRPRPDMRVKGRIEKEQI